MKKTFVLSLIFMILAIVLSGCGGGKKSSNPPTIKKIYIIKNYEDITSLATYLEGEGYEVSSIDVLNLATVATSTLSSYDLFVITNDTGQWNGEDSPSLAAKILDTGKPCLGFGGGGLGFYRHVTPQISLQYTNGPHYDFCYRVNVVDATDPLWAGLTVTNGQIVDFYTDMTVNGHGVPTANLSASAEQFGTDNLQYPEPAVDCAILAREGRFFAWGFTGFPNVMTANGRTVFRNVLSILLGD